MNPHNFDSDSESDIAFGSYRPITRVALLCGIPMFVGFGFMGLYYARSDSQTLVQVCLFILMAAGFLWAAWFGTRLLPFVFATIAAGPDGLRISRRSGEQYFLWSSISHAVDHRGMQVLDVYSRDGNRILSIDYFLTGYPQVGQCIYDNVAIRS